MKNSMKKVALRKILKSLSSNLDSLKLHQQLGLLAILFGVTWTQNAVASQDIDIEIENSAKENLGFSVDVGDRRALVDLLKQIEQHTTLTDREKIYDWVNGLTENQQLSLLESIDRGEDLDELIAQLLDDENTRLVLDENNQLLISSNTSATKVISSEFGSDSTSATDVTSVATETAVSSSSGIVAMSGFSPLTAIGGLVGIAAATGGGGGGLLEKALDGLRGIQGKAIDGYLMGANVFVRALDGSLTRVGSTNDLGQFVGLDNTLGLKLSNAQASLPIVVSGGVDQSTQRAFTGQLEAPAGSLVVTPLTTVLQKMLDANSDLSVAEAETALQTSLGIVGNVDLLSFDPIEMAGSSDPAVKAIGLQIYQKSIELVTSAVMADLASSSLNFDSALALAAQSLAQRITQILTTNPDSLADLSSSTNFMSAVFTGFGSALGDSLSSVREQAFLAVNQLAGAENITSVDMIRNLIDRDNTVVGSDVSKLLKTSVTESELLALKSANQMNRNKMFDGEKFLSIGDISSTVDGTTLADSNLDLVTLSRLGIDEILPDSNLSGRIDVGLGFDAAVNQLLSGNSQPSQLQREEAEDSVDYFLENAPRFANSAQVNLGFTSEEMQGFIGDLESTLSASNGASSIQDALSIFQSKNIDSIALSSVASGPRGEVLISDELAEILSASDFSFADYFSTKEDDSSTQIQTHLIVEGTTLAGFDLSQQDLDLLGVDEIRFGQLFQDEVGYFDSLNEAVQFASATNFDDRFGSRIDVGLKVTLDQGTLDAIESLLSPQTARMASFFEDESAPMPMSDVEPTMLNFALTTTARNLDSLELDFDPLFDSDVDYLIIGTDGQSAQQVIDLSDLEDAFLRQFNT